MNSTKYTSKHPKTLERFRHQFGEDKLVQLKASYDIFSKSDEEVFVYFFKRSSPEKCPHEISAEFEDFTTIVSVQFTEEAVSASWMRTILMVELR